MGGDKRIMFARNHGVFVVGPSVAECFDDIYCEQSKMMNFVLKMMDFVLKMMIFLLKMMNFVQTSSVPAALWCCRSPPDRPCAIF